MRYSLSIGKIAGISVYLHWTFLILVGWIMMGTLQAGATWIDAMWSLLLLATIFLCITLHEVGHALMARRFGIATRDITLLPIGGLARMEALPEKPREELLVALAGPAVNLVIALILFPFVQRIDPNLAMSSIGAVNFVPALFGVNIWLALFNLIPAFPMDGGRVFRALLAFRTGYVRATRTAAALGQVLAMVFVFAGFMLNPFLIFIGLFIFLGAQAEAGIVETRFALRDHTVKDVLMHEVPTLDDTASMRDAACRLLNSQNKNFLVLHEGQPVGILTRQDIITTLRTHGEKALVRDAIDTKLEYLNPGMPLDKAWSKMQSTQKPMMLVMDEGQIKGAVDEESIEELILIHTARSQHN
jgi:Zn-dependent protease